MRERGIEREGERSGDRGRGGSGIGRWGQAGSGVGGLRLARWWAALGTGWAGWPGWRLGLSLFFELERRENIEKYILFLYRTYIYIKILRGINPTTWTFFQR